MKDSDLFASPGGSFFFFLAKFVIGGFFSLLEGVRGDVGGGLIVFPASGSLDFATTGSL